MAEKSLCILLAEDHAVLARNEARLIAALGHQVLGPVATVREAVTLLRESTPDLVLADMTLSDGSGLELIHACVDAGIPCAGVSGEPRPRDGSCPPPVAWLQKPFSGEELLEVIAVCCPADPGDPDETGGDAP